MHKENSIVEVCRGSSHIYQIKSFNNPRLFNCANQLENLISIITLCCSLVKTKL